MTISNLLERAGEWIEHLLHIKAGLKEEGNYVSRYVKPMDLQQKMEVGLIYQKNQVKTWIKKLTKLIENNGLLQRKKPDPLEYMSQLRQKIGVVENDIDSLQKTIHGKELHQIYKDSPTRKKIFSNKKEKPNLNSIDVDYESRHNYAKETFNTKINRLSNDYKRACDKLSQVPTKGKKSENNYLSNFSSKNSCIESANEAATQKRGSSSAKKVKRRPSTTKQIKHPQNWKVNLHKIDASYPVAFSVSSENSSKFSYQVENHKKEKKGNSTNIPIIVNSIKVLQKEHREVRNELHEIKSILNMLTKESNNIKRKIGY